MRSWRFAPRVQDMDPVSALREIAYYKELAREESRRVMAYRKAAEIIAGLSPQERERHGANKTWKSLTGLGPKTATVAAEAWAGKVPATLEQLRANAKSTGGERCVKRSKVTCICTPTGQMARCPSRK